MGAVIVASIDGRENEAIAGVCCVDSCGLISK